jgi:hypothetical protein
VSRWFPESIVLRVGDAARVLDGVSPQAAVTLPGTPAMRADTGSVSDTPRIDTMLLEFECELERLAPQRGTSVTCVVAGDAARYRIVPWNDELARPAQRQVLAEHCFTEAYGEQTRTWIVRQQSARHGAASLACALDSALLDGLEVRARARRLKLVSVQPSLMHAFNSTPPRLGREPCWFVCIDALWTTVLLLSPTEPLHLKQIPSIGLDLSLSLDREGFALGLEGPRSPVHTRRFAAGSWAVVASPASVHSGGVKKPSAETALERQVA